MPFLLRTALAFLLLACLPAGAADYVPPRGAWERQAPATAGFDPERDEFVARSALMADSYRDWRRDAFGFAIGRFRVP